MPVPSRTVVRSAWQCGGAMRASADSQPDLRRRDPRFAAGKRTRARHAAHARCGRTRDARGTEPGRKSVLGAVGAIAFAAALTGTLVVGWCTSKEGDLTEIGVGYWPGIAGASTMLLLVLYPVHKRMNAAHSILRPSAWFPNSYASWRRGPGPRPVPLQLQAGVAQHNVQLLAMLSPAVSDLDGRHLYSVRFCLMGGGCTIKPSVISGRTVAIMLGHRGCAAGTSVSLEGCCRCTSPQSTDPLFRHSTSAKQDDAHDGEFRRGCESCHNTNSLKQGAMGR